MCDQINEEMNSVAVCRTALAKLGVFDIVCLGFVQQDRVCRLRGSHSWHYGKVSEAEEWRGGGLKY